jgi:AraC-like DNA-binding protein
MAEPINKKENFPAPVEIDAASDMLLFQHDTQGGICLRWRQIPRESERIDVTLSGSGLNICLNYSGMAYLDGTQIKGEIMPRQVAIYSAGKTSLRISRPGGHLHRYFTIEADDSALQSFLGEAAYKSLAPEIQHNLKSGKLGEGYVQINPMNSSLIGLRDIFLQPPVSEIARDIFFRGKLLEVLAYTLFEQMSVEAPPRQRKLRQRREKIEKAAYLLRRDYENPPTLSMLATEVGMSPHYLSRLFSEQMEMTIPQYLRLIRIEKAAEMLRQGKCNVTEAAMAVGYTSLSAFNSAFVEIMGCCPGLYPAAKKLIRSKF